MFDTVQTTADFVSKIKLSFQLAALDTERDFLSYDVLAREWLYVTWRTFKKHNTKE